MSAPSHPTFNLGSFLEKDKLKTDGSNFTSWFRTLRILLIPLKMSYVLETALGDAPATTATPAEKNVYLIKSDDSSLVQKGMLYAMEAELQKRFESLSAYEIIIDLKTIFAPQARVERNEVSEAFFSAKMEEHSSMTEHVVKMSDYVQRLNDLEFKIPDELAIDRVLRSLPPCYENFVLNYNVQGMVKTLSELFTMLKIAEMEIKKEHSCTKYLEDKKAGKVAGRDMDICDIHVIDVFLTSARSNVWIFDTGSVAHICNSQEGLQNKRLLRKNEVTMRVGNGSKVDVMSIGTLRLSLPSGLILVLNKCYYVPALSMNIVSGSCLMQDQYSFKSETTGCSVHKNNVFYVHAPVRNGLFLIDLEYHDSHINNIEAKRLKRS